jgi:glycosyltransferase involved in cell wall biosynthesis
VRNDGGRGLSGKITHFISQLSGFFASRIIVKSGEMMSALWRPNRRKATVIANGVDMELFSPVDKEEARRQLSWDIDKKYVLFFPGGGAPVKDPDLARAAFAYACERAQGCELVLVENVPHEELVWYYNAADALMITSLHEGSNNSLKEAMCCNLPVVSVVCGDARERLLPVDQCRVVDERSHEAVGRALLDVILADRRSDGRRFMEDFSLEHVARKIVEVYASALQDTGNGKG